jgi:predicted outer membrane repeat protein
VVAYNSAGYISVTGCTFTGCTNISSIDVCGVWNFKGCPVFITNSTFSYLIGVAYAGPGTLRNCTFANNPSTEMITSSASTLTLEDCTIYNNSAYILLIIDPAATLILKNTNFIENVAASSLIVAYFLSGSISNCTFVSNSAQTGALYVYSSVGFTISDTTFIQNRANGTSNSGGAIYLKNCCISYIQFNCDRYTLKISEYCYYQHDVFK